jgi:hypothetical protein
MASTTNSDFANPEIGPAERCSPIAVGSAAWVAAPQADPLRAPGRWVTSEPFPGLSPTPGHGNGQILVSLAVIGVHRRRVSPTPNFTGRGLEGGPQRFRCFGLPVKSGLPRRLNERGVLNDFEVLGGDLVLAEMVGGDGSLQHLESGLDRLGAGDVLLVIIRRVQLCGDGRGQ